MRRSTLVAGAVVAALLLATVAMATAQAAGPARSTSTIFVAICDGVEPTARETGRTMHTTEGYWYAGNQFYWSETSGSRQARSAPLSIGPPGAMPAA